MNDTRILKTEQVAAFKREGFVFVPAFFDSSQAARVTWWTDEIMNWPERQGRHMVYYEDSLKRPRRRVVQRIENFVPYHESFRVLLTEGRMLGAVSDLLGEPAVLFKEKINFKQPGGAGFTPHQDMQAGWHRYAGHYVTALVSIDPATLANGCLEIAPGWHDRGMLGAERAPLAAAALEAMDFVPYPTQPGDAVFFDGFTPHRSAPNLTNSQRRVLYVTYNRASEGEHRARYFADKRRAIPPEIERAPGETHGLKV